MSGVLVGELAEPFRMGSSGRVQVIAIIPWQGTWALFFLSLSLLLGCHQVSKPLLPQ